MNIETFVQSLNAYPACYMVMGIALGYFLRGYVLGISSFSLNKKRSGRYRDLPVEASQHSAKQGASNDPLFERVGAGKTL